MMRRIQPRAVIAPQTDACTICAKPFPRRRRNPKTSLCRTCWSIKALELRG